MFLQAVKPYSDETFHSIAARTLKRHSMMKRSEAIGKVTGSVSETFFTMISFPHRIGYFVKNLPSKHYSTQYFIERHTLLPYCAPFLDERIASALRLKMECNNRQHLPSGGFGPRSLLSEFLAFCPSCVEEDIHTFEECYWHRSHQIRAVTVCFKHAVFLENSGISSCITGSTIDSTAEGAVYSTTPRKIDFQNASHLTMLGMARNAAWLLNDSGFHNDYRTRLREKFKGLLIERELGTYGSKNRPQSMISEFKKYYCNELLQTLGCNPDAKWLPVIASMDTECNPQAYLLFMDFLGYSCQDFFEQDIVHQPFGMPPWPCLNPTCADNMKPVISTCKLQYHSQKGATIEGEFECHCGYTYQRRGPDKTTEDQFRADKVVRYGNIWDDTFRKLWADRTKTIHVMQQILGLSFKGIHAAAIRLNLQEREQTIEKRIREDLGIGAFDEVDLEQICTQKWLNVVAAYPRASVTELKFRVGWAYSWLKRNKPAWLESHIP